MYRVYADDIVIHDDKFIDGDVKLINPVLTLSDSAAGSFVFSISHKSPAYNKIQRFTTTIRVEQEYGDTMKEIWSGRVIQEEEDFWKNQKYTCEGELAYLNDTLQPPHEYHHISVREFLQTMLDIHNSRVDDSKKFLLGYVSPDAVFEDTIPIDEQGVAQPRYIKATGNYDPNQKYYTPDSNGVYAELADLGFFQHGEDTIDLSQLGYDVYIENPNYTGPPDTTLYRYTNRETTLECINTKVLEDIGGHLVVRKEGSYRYLDYYSDYPKTATQVVEFGSNLLDFTKNWDLTDFATVIVPLGEMIQHDEDWEGDENHPKALGEYTTVESVNNNSPYVIATEPMERFGWVEKVVTWDKVSEPSRLLAKAQKYLTDFQFDKMVLVVSALDLHYMDPVGVGSFELLDRVRIISQPHGLDRYFPVTKISIALDSPDSTVYTFGDAEERSLTSATSTMSADFTDKIEKTKTEVLENAKNNASILINNRTQGFVTLVKGPHGTSELIISATDNWNNSLGPDTEGVPHWRWNMGGLGYCDGSKYADGTYKYTGPAITMDGSIVADFITAGVLDADVIKGGIIQDRKKRSYWNMETGQMKLVCDEFYLTSEDGPMSLLDIINQSSDYIYLDHGKLYINVSMLKMNGISVAGEDVTNYLQWDEDAINVGYASIVETPFLINYHIIFQPKVKIVGQSGGSTIGSGGGTTGGGGGGMGMDVGGGGYSYISDEGAAGGESAAGGLSYGMVLFRHVGKSNVDDLPNILDTYSTYTKAQVHIGDSDGSVPSGVNIAEVSYFDEDLGHRYLGLDLYKGTLNKNKVYALDGFLIKTVHQYHPDLLYPFN